jgi:hypothetical protein
MRLSFTVFSRKLLSIVITYFNGQLTMDSGIEN